MLHRKGDRTRQLSVGVFGVSLHLWRGIVPSPLYAPVKPALCAPTLYKFIVPMPSAINSTNFSSLVSTALFPESNRSGALSLPAEPVERDIQRKVLEPQLTCRHWHIPVLCYRVCSRFEDFQPLKTFQKNISTPKLKRFLRYFSSLVLARFGVVVNSQYPTSGISVFGVPLHLCQGFTSIDRRTAMIGFEPMIPVRCRMLDPFITLAAGFQANP